MALIMHWRATLWRGKAGVAVLHRCFSSPLWLLLFLSLLSPLTHYLSSPRDRQVYERDLDRLYTLNKDERDAAISTQVISPSPKNR